MDGCTHVSMDGHMRLALLDVINTSCC